MRKVTHPPIFLSFPFLKTGEKIEKKMKQLARKEEKCEVKVLGPETRTCAPWNLLFFAETKRFPTANTVTPVLFSFFFLILPSNTNTNISNWDLTRHIKVKS